jgi:hypothetical protein
VAPVAPQTFNEEISVKRVKYDPKLPTLPVGPRQVPPKKK